MADVLLDPRHCSSHFPVYLSGTRVENIHIGDSKIFSIHKYTRGRSRPSDRLSSWRDVTSWRISHMGDDERVENPGTGSGSGMGRGRGRGRGRETRKRRSTGESGPRTLAGRAASSLIFPLFLRPTWSTRPNNKFESPLGRPLASPVQTPRGQ